MKTRWLTFHSGGGFFLNVGVSASINFKGRYNPTMHISGSMPHNVPKDMKKFFSPLAPKRRWNEPVECEDFETAQQAQDYAEEKVREYYYVKYGKEPAFYPD